MILLEVRSNLSIWISSQRSSIRSILLTDKFSTLRKGSRFKGLGFFMPFSAKSNLVTLIIALGLISIFDILF